MAMTPAARRKDRSSGTRVGGASQRAQAAPRARSEPHAPQAAKRKDRACRSPQANEAGGRGRGTSKALEYRALARFLKHHWASIGQGRAGGVMRPGDKVVGFAENGIQEPTRTLTSLCVTASRTDKPSPDAPAKSRGLPGRDGAAQGSCSGPWRLFLKEA